MLTASGKWFSHLTGTLPVNFKKNITAFGHCVLNPLLGGSVVVSVNFCGF